MVESDNEVTVVDNPEEVADGKISVGISMAVAVITSLGFGPDLKVRGQARSKRAEDTARREAFNQQASADAEQRRKIRNAKRAAVTGRLPQVKEVATWK